MLNQTFTGALDDNRSPLDKEKDYLQEEVAFGGNFEWKEKESFRSFPIRDQDGSGSCVAQSLALILGIENFLEEETFIEFSASDIYQQRSNRGAGMIGNDALEIVRKGGSTFEFLMPSQEMSESEINAVPRKASFGQVGQVYKTGGYVHLPLGNIDQAASISATGKGVMVWFMFPRKEWTSTPTLSNKMNVSELTSARHQENNLDIVHHSVTVVDYALIGGEKFLVIQDSWGHHSTTDNGLRYISEAYFQKRNTFAAYVLDLSNTWRDDVEPIEDNTPSYKFTKTLKLGSRNDEVVQLQDALKHLNLFPNISSTGYFGAITKRSVQKFQEKYNLQSDGIVGRNTRSQLNNLFS